MKKISKVLLSLIISFTILLCLPFSVRAISGSFNGQKTSENASLTVGKLEFSNIKYKDWSNTTTGSFGLSGTVKNNYDTSIKYKVTINYYDENGLVIKSISATKVALKGTYDFNQMADKETVVNASLSDIKSYDLVVDVDETGSNTVIPNQTPSEFSSYQYNDYVIDKYDVNIKVNKNNSYDITENITAYFNVHKHGIYRSIPLLNTVKKSDGTTSKNFARITNLSVNGNYETSVSDNHYVVKIGDADKTYIGKKSYVIKYTYNIGEDKNKDFNEFYYNIIGTEWDVPVGNVTFTITMPKKFDSSRLGFAAGSYGATDSGNILYNVKGNVITGEYYGILSSNEGITTRLTLDKNYYVGDKNYVSVWAYVMIFLPIVFLGIAYFIWSKYGKDDKAFAPVNFYPPEDYNSLDVGYLYRGYAEKKDVVSLLIYLADKGYLKIAETVDKDSLFKSKSFKIIKVKDYDGSNNEEKKFMKGLFKNSHTEDKQEVVTKEDLEDSFYVTMNRLISSTNAWHGKEKIFESTILPTFFIALLGALTLFMMVFVPYADFYGLSDFAYLAIGPVIMLIIYMIISSKGLSAFLRIFIGTLAVLVSVLITSQLPENKISFMMSTIYLIDFLVGAICMFLMMLFSSKMSKRTKYGTKILGDIIGFRNFLQAAEKPKLEELVLQDPEYFYKILPYTYVLGVSDKWIKKFEVITMEKPEWYDSDDAFNYNHFNSFIDDTFSSSTVAMSSAPAPSSSSGSSGGSDFFSGGSSFGGSSGGGFSGGGSGGGGGSSW